MSPEPNLRAQASALALALLAESLLGSPLLGLILSLVCGAGFLFLRANYRTASTLARSIIPPHRERLDRIVDGDTQTLLAVGITAGGVMRGFGLDRVDIGLARATPLLVAIAALVVYLSSLFDWFVILPRISGLLGARPCRVEPEDHPRYPHTWRDTTRWWMIHRVVAALVVRFALPYAFTLTLGRYVSLPHGTQIVGAAVFLFLASYLKAVPDAVMMQAGHPTVIVGDTVRVAESTRVWRRIRLFGRLVPLPVKGHGQSSQFGPREWVYDVSLESVQVVAASEREGEVPRWPDGSVRYERRPRKIRLQDLARCVPAEPFSGCEQRCSGINWYCIENPRCFESK